MQSLINVRWYENAFKVALKNEDDSEARRLFEMVRFNHELLCEVLRLVVGRDGMMAFGSAYIAASILLFDDITSPYFFMVKESVLKNIIIAARQIEVKRESKNFLEILLSREDIRLSFYEKEEMQKVKELLEKENLIGNFKMNEDVY